MIPPPSLVLVGYYLGVDGANWDFYGVACWLLGLDSRPSDDGKVLSLGPFGPRVTDPRALPGEPGGSPGTDRLHTADSLWETTLDSRPPTSRKVARSGPSGSSGVDSFKVNPLRSGRQER